MKKYKICKGINKSLGFDGCNDLVLAKTRRNGLCPSCYKKWYLLNTLSGEQRIKKAISMAQNKLKKQKRKEFTDKKKSLNVKGAMQLADMYFSRYIRLKFSVDGKCTCYTCGTIKDIKDVDNGHYMKREHQATRYHENNCKPQCKTCNGDTKHNGKQAEFRVNLVNEIGENEVVKIESLSKNTFKTNSKYFRDIAERYRVKVNELQKKIGVKYW